jgi:hypothetical protein
MPNNLFTFPPMKTNRLQVPDDEPVYRVTGKGFFDGESLLEEYDALGKPVLIAYDGEPNFSLIPMNEKAVKKVQEWIEGLNESAKDAKKSKEHGARELVGLQETSLRAYLAQITSDGRFDAKRIQPAILSNNIHVGRTRRIEQPEMNVAEIKSVMSNKKQDQTELVNG